MTLGRSLAIEDRLQCQFHDRDVRQGLEGKQTRLPQVVVAACRAAKIECRANGYERVWIAQVRYVTAQGL